MIRDKEKKLICPDCYVHEKKPSSQRCLKCANVRYLEQCKISYEKLSKEKSKLKDLNKTFKECKKCKEYFNPESVDQVYCHNPCSYKIGRQERFIKKSAIKGSGYC